MHRFEYFILVDADGPGSSISKKHAELIWVDYATTVTR